MKGFPREVINHLYCATCNYSTQKKKSMETHQRTIKHKRNNDKKFKVSEGPKEINRRTDSIQRDKILIDFGYCPLNENYTNMNKLFEGYEIGEYEKLVMQSYQNLTELEQLFKELPDDNVLAKLQGKMILEKVRSGHKDIVDNYCTERSPAP